MRLGASLIAADVVNDTAAQAVTIALIVVLVIAVLAIVGGIALGLVRRRRLRRRDLDW